MKPRASSRDFTSNSTPVASNFIPHCSSSYSHQTTEAIVNYPYVIQAKPQLSVYSDIFRFYSASRLQFLPSANIIGNIIHRYNVFSEGIMEINLEGLTLLHH